MRSTHVVLAVVAAVASLAALVFAALYFTKGSGGEATGSSETCGDRIFGHLVPDPDRRRVQLAELVEGEKPVDLFEPLDSGVWIRVHIDTVCDVEQQYRP